MVRSLLRVVAVAAVILQLPGCVKTSGELLDTASHVGLPAKVKSTSKVISHATSEATSADASTCLGLVNGQTIGAAVNPAVVLIQLYDGDTPIQYCSGTFVSDHALLTAGHCVDHSATGNIQLMTLPASGNFHDTFDEEGIASVQAFNQGYTYAESQAAADNDVALNDVALVLFPPNTAPAVMQLAPVLPAVGSQVTLVGFGVSSYSDQAEDTSTGMIKRTGTNTVIKSPDFIPGQSPSIISIGGDVANAPGVAMGSFGDSGSPLVFNNTIAGTYRSSPYATTPGGQTLYFGQYIATSSAATQQLIATANLAGANIPSVPVAGNTCQ